MANHFRTPEAKTDAPRPESVRVERKTREHRGPGRGHHGTVDTPTAESEPPEDSDIHRAKPLPHLSLRHLLELSLPPLLRLLRTLSLPPLLSLLLLRRMLLLGSRTPTQPRKWQQGVLETLLPQMRRMPSQKEKGWPTNPTANRTNWNTRRTMPPDVGEVVGGRIDHNCSCHCLLFFVSSSRPMLSTVLCHLHTS